MAGADSGYAGTIGQCRSGFGRLPIAHVGEPGATDSGASGNGDLHGRGYVWVGAAVWNRRSGAGSGVDQCPEQLPLSAASSGSFATHALQSDAFAPTWAVPCEPGGDGGVAAVGPVIASASGVVVDWNCVGCVLRIVLRISVAGWVGQ